MRVSVKQKCNVTRAPNARLVYLEKSAHLLTEEMNEVITLLTDFLA